MNPGKGLQMITLQQSVEGMLKQINILNVATSEKGIVGYDGRIWAW